MANFTIADAVAFSELLDCPNLSQRLLARLSHTLYGADERAKRKADQDESR